ncbi:Protoheme IX farnesyltransferase [Candidatus Zixiibacteriota bacterium]|nr:Protoheme IX farnesyltransferase [candidate division Zixibacteria bacterium]
MQNRVSYLKSMQSTDRADFPAASKIVSPSSVAVLSRLKSYLQMTKPSIMLLVLVTGLAALFVEGSMPADPARMFLFLLGLYLTGGSANSFNQYFEREIDARMIRTRRRRPLPLGKLSPSEALAFSIIIGLSGVLLLGFVFNWLTALLSLATILFYSLFYTLVLKPTTSQNIVIGGIAGAMAPVGAWTAATGGMALMPWFMFLIVFLWTPPHFWSLALCFQDDYRAAGYPMLPLVKGPETTLQQIFYYSLALVLSSFLPLFAGAGWFYTAVALLSGVIFIVKTVRTRRLMSQRAFWGVFKFSIIYLFALFIALVIDKYI